MQFLTINPPITKTKTFNNTAHVTIFFIEATIIAEIVSGNRFVIHHIETSSAGFTMNFLFIS